MQKNISSCTFLAMSEDTLSNDLLLGQKYTQMKIIGHIKSCYPEKFGVPRQPGIVKDVVSELIIAPEWQPEAALEGLSDYSYLWIIFIFHKNNTSHYHAKVHPPRLDGLSKGVFATRSPHRPNPIGLSLVKIKEVANDRIFFWGGDLVEGTPVLDIKPYLPQFESQPEASGGWSAQIKKNIKVEFSTTAAEKVQLWMNRKQDVNLKKSIIEIVQEDPRPTVYKGFEQKESPYRNQHAFRLYDADIHFKFLSEDHAVIIDIIF